ncbi:MAG: hypothetical protein ACOX0A_08625 [Thermoguttaceae bacterium]
MATIRSTNSDPADLRRAWTVDTDGAARSETFFTPSVDDRTSTLAKVLLL